MSTLTTDRPELRDEPDRQDLPPIARFREHQASSREQTQRRQVELAQTPTAPNQEQEHEDYLRQQIDELGSPYEEQFASFDAEQQAQECKKLITLSRSLIAERETAVTNYQGRDYHKGSFLKRIWQGALNVVEPKITDKEARVLFRQKEAEICGTKVFSDPNVSFFCVDEQRWMYNKLDADGNVFASVDYYIRDSHVMVRQVGYADRVLRGQDFTNFISATKQSRDEILAQYAKI